MLKELDEAVQTLKTGGHDVFPKYDIIYEGNYTKWCKFANSLMLRLAMRIVYANPTLAQQYAEKAITNPYGVIESTKDAAQLSKGAGVTLKNPLTIINGSYNDVRMGAEISSYLKGYNDPRIGSYFVKAKSNGIEGYYGVRTKIASIKRRHLLSTYKMELRSTLSRLPRSISSVQRVHSAAGIWVEALLNRIMKKELLHLSRKMI